MAGRKTGAFLLKAAGLLLLWCACLIAFPFPAAAEEAPVLSVSLPETVKGYTPCEIEVWSPAEGEAELRLYDSSRNLWMVRKEHAAEGRNAFPWDGLGESGEQMYAGRYRFEVLVNTADGQVLTGEKQFEIKGSTPALVYALPSSGTLYLDNGERWFVECFVSGSCLVAMEIKDSGGNVVYSREDNIRKPEGEQIYWAGTLSARQKIAPGEYTVRMWSRKNPDYERGFSLKVKEKTPEKVIAPTGPVIPERGMSDSEIWEIMMKPSVVINDSGSFRQFKLYSRPDTNAGSKGILRCAVQGMEVLEVNGNWARVKAWRHNDATPAEGYLPLWQLTVSAPGEHYGVLVDKRDQTMTVYEDGKPIGTVPVSTGLVTGRGDKWRETTPGAFLTDVHSGSSFAEDGFRYEYPLRYDGRNLIHGSGFIKNGRTRDYADHEQLLGQKASHGCVRVSLFRRADNPVNMYWLWVHLPFHSRIIILDD